MPIFEILFQQVVTHRNVAFLAAVRSLEEASAADTVLQCMWYLFIYFILYNYLFILFIQLFCFLELCLNHELFNEIMYQITFT